MYKMEEDIINKISNGEYSLTNKRRGRSLIWDTFAEIIDQNGQFLDNYVYCRTCKRIFKYNGKQTSNLVRHACYSIKRNEVPLKQLGPEEKKIMLEACSQWIIEDCRPCSSVAGSGFRKLVQTIIKIGAACGENLDVEDLLPHPISVSRQINTLAEEKKIEKKTEINEIIENGQATITTNVWTDNFVKRNFLGATFHYVKNEQFHEMVLGIKSMDYENSNSETIGRKIRSILSEFDINSSNSDKIIFVTDKRPNIRNALKDYERINCSYYLFESVLQSAFDSTTELQGLIENCQKLVKYLKKSNLNNLLPTTLKGHYATHLNSNLVLFKSVFNNWSTINEILSKMDELDRLLEIDLNILTVLTELCDKFETISSKLQDTKNVSISFVYPSINRLLKICEVTEGDNPAVASLKSNIRQQVDTKWIPNLSVYHEAAVFLYPPSNSMQDKDVISDIKDFCVAEILQNADADEDIHQDQEIQDDIKIEVEKMDELSSYSSSTATADMPSTSKELDFFFPELSEKATVTHLVTERIIDEVDRYSRLRTHLISGFDAIHWWENHKLEYPNLWKLATKMLSIPASCSASERVFELAGNITSEKRNLLVPKTVSNIMFLNSICKETDKILI